MKSRYIVPFLLLAVVIAGCADDEITSSSGDGGVFIGGRDGVVVTFEPLGLEESGIFTIYDTENFPLLSTVSVICWFMGYV